MRIISQRFLGRNQPLKELIIRWRQEWLHQLENLSIHKEVGLALIAQSLPWAVLRFPTKLNWTPSFPDPKFCMSFEVVKRDCFAEYKDFASEPSKEIVL